MSNESDRPPSYEASEPSKTVRPDVEITREHPLPPPAHASATSTSSTHGQIIPRGASHTSFLLTAPRPVIASLMVSGAPAAQKPQQADTAGQTNKFKRCLAIVFIRVPHLAILAASPALYPYVLYNRAETQQHEILYKVAKYTLSSWFSTVVVSCVLYYCDSSSTRPESSPDIEAEEAGIKRKAARIASLPTVATSLLVFVMTCAACAISDLVSQFSVSSEH